ncbi:response regulator [Oscillochloris sp. ZM17-4]|uniref:response regulator n=1 Tax=Oscillochloris sp. ZM17-4 TaxID=2866714 RepID=UPI001C7327AD|nr:response regulator [Oscillochloris sp. ZM17-4]MBX0330777.1 response regulator [Oscillochloris sp. ZM17-4]
MTRVLLADDHAVVRAGIANALSGIPDLLVVGEVGDGFTLFAALQSLHPDCLLIDVTMPHFEPIADIGRAHEMYPQMKILVVSAYDDDIYVQGLLAVGVNGYHLKDQPLKDLQLAVQRVLAGERWICSPLVDKLVRLREASPLTLTERQRELLLCLQEGLDNLGIARRTGLSVKTVENHLTRLYRHLGVQSRLEAVSYVHQHATAIGLGGSASPPLARESDRYPPRFVLMIVDDNVRYRTQLRRMIGKAYPAALILEVGGTQEALRLAQANPPQLALVDVVLGDESGIDCARMLHSALPSVRVVLFSAYPDREFHRQGIAAGAVAFLDKKDVDAAALRELIDDVVV